MNVILAKSPIFDAYIQSDFFGKSIFLSLLLLSLLTWVIFAQKFYTLHVAKRKSFLFQENFNKRRQNPLGIDVQKEAHPFNAIYRTMKHQTFEVLSKNRTAVGEERPIYLSHSDIELIDAHLGRAISGESKKLEKNLFILSTVVSLAPFLGLLGTVWGILLTFSELQMGGTASANATVMGGLAMALGTTVLGLVVAIPALIAYNYLRASSLRFVADMRDFSHLALASVELQYRKIDIL